MPDGIACYFGVCLYRQAQIEKRCLPSGYMGLPPKEGFPRGRDGPGTELILKVGTLNPRSSRHFPRTLVRLSNSGASGTPCMLWRGESISRWDAPGEFEGQCRSGSAWLGPIPMPGSGDRKMNSECRTLKVQLSHLNTVLGVER
jgi:hypothetical protein